MISVGEENTYGHPAPATLATLAAHGVRALRTDRDGGVVLDIGRGGIEVRAETDLVPTRLDELPTHYWGFSRRSSLAEDRGLRSMVIPVSVLGDRLLDRLRSATFAMLGLVTAVGLVLVALPPAGLAQRLRRALSLASPSPLLTRSLRRSPVAARYRSPSPGSIPRRHGPGRHPAAGASTAPRVSRGRTRWPRRLRSRRAQVPRRAKPPLRSQLRRRPWSTPHLRLLHRRRWLPRLPKPPIRQRAPRSVTAMATRLPPRARAKPARGKDKVAANGKGSSSKGSTTTASKPKSSGSKSKPSSAKPSPPPVDKASAESVPSKPAPPAYEPSKNEATLCRWRKRASRAPASGTARTSSAARLGPRL